MTDTDISSVQSNSTQYTTLSLTSPNTHHDSSPQIQHSTYIRKLPYSVISKLRSMLDPDYLWKKLCCVIMESDGSRPRYSVLDIKNFELSIARGGSPTEDVLRDWGTQNTTVSDLLDRLLAAQLYYPANYMSQQILHEGPVHEPTAVTPISSEMSMNDSFSTSAGSGSCGDERQFSLHVVNAASSNEVMQSPNVQQNNTITIVKTGSDMIEYPYSVLSRLTRGFDCRSVTAGGHCVGTGGFATVYRAEYRTEHAETHIAIKALTASKPDVSKQFKTELELLSNYTHPNLLGLLGYSIDGPQLCLVYPYMSGGSLLDRLKLKCDKSLSWPKRLDVAIDTASGLDYLHNHYQKLIHRDIKSANILLDSSDSAKIGDFGIAKLCPSPGLFPSGPEGDSDASSGSGLTTSFQTNTVIGTSAYMSPEAYRGTITSKMDVFAYGVILLELITGQAPMDDTREETDLISYVEEECDNLMKILDPRCQISEEVGELVYDVARRCYANSKRDRPTITQVREELLSIKTQSE